MSIAHFGLSGYTGESARLGPERSFSAPLAGSNTGEAQAVAERPTHPTAVPEIRPQTDLTQIPLLSHVHTEYA